MTYAAEVFDMDGVILRSNGLKSEAFRLATLPYGAEAAEAMVALHRGAGSIGRRARVERFFAEVLSLPEAAESEIERVVEAVGRELAAGYRSVPLVAGFDEYLNRIIDRGIDYLVVTGVDETEARGILVTRERIGHLLQADTVFGGPAKRARIAQLLDCGEFALPALYWGDTLDDYRAARANGLDFGLVTCDAEWDWASWLATEPEGVVQVVADFTAVLPVMEAPA